MERENSKVIALLAQWGFTAESIGNIEPVLDVYRVETAQGPMNLKWTRHPDEKLLFIVSALHHLAERGFQQFSRPLPTVDGRPFLVHEGQHYLLSPWIEGRQADWGRTEELTASCRLLAGFHRASRGFKPQPGKPVRALWGSMLPTLAKRCRELERFARLWTAGKPAGPFAEEARREADYYLALARFAFNLLKASSYRQMSSRGADQGGLCHGDVAARNFIWTTAGTVHLIDFDGIRQDIFLMDLWKLFRRLMKKFDWRIDLGAQVIAAYESVSPISARELEVLLALTSFPEKYWRLANRLHSGRFGGQEFKLHQKLKKYTAQRKAHAAFLSYLARCCRERGVDPSTWPACPFIGTEIHDPPLRQGHGSGHSRL